MIANTYGRLSEIANFTVGLIEAGDYRPDDPKILVGLCFSLLTALINVVSTLDPTGMECFRAVG